MELFHQFRAQIQQLPTNRGRIAPSKPTLISLCALHTKIQNLNSSVQGTTEKGDFPVHKWNRHALACPGSGQIFLNSRKEKGRKKEGKSDVGISRQFQLMRPCWLIVKLPIPLPLNPIQRIVAIMAPLLSVFLLLIVCLIQSNQIEAFQGSSFNRFAFGKFLKMSSHADKPEIIRGKKWPGNRPPINNPMLDELKMDASWGRGKFRDEIWEDNLCPKNEWWRAYEPTDEEYEAMALGYDFSNPRKWHEVRTTLYSQFTFNFTVYVGKRHRLRCSAVRDSKAK